MDNYSITRNGKPLSTYQYRIDLENKVFSTSSQHLILDFGCLRGWTFKTGGNCTFKTGGNCTFTTGKLCTLLLWDINTCKFKTPSHSIILDRNNRKHYILTKDLIQLLKVTNG